jgi:hypothetical protein
MKPERNDPTPTGPRLIARTNGPAMQAFVAVYGEIGQPLTDGEWLELFRAFLLGWSAGREERAAQVQPQPQSGSAEIYPLVIADIQARVAAGREKYGTTLQANNGRDALLDLYQELIDAVFYVRQLMEEEAEQ